MNFTEMNSFYTLSLAGTHFAKLQFLLSPIMEAFVYTCTLTSRHVRLGMIEALFTGTCNLAGCFHGNKDENVPTQGIMFPWELSKFVTWEFLWPIGLAEGMKAGTVCAHLTLVSDFHNVWKKLFVSSMIRLECKGILWKMNMSARYHWYILTFALPPPLFLMQWHFIIGDWGQRQCLHLRVFTL